MASASALAGAFTNLAVSANRTAKKTNVVAKKVRDGERGGMGLDGRKKKKIRTWVGWEAGGGIPPASLGY